MRNLFDYLKSLTETKQDLSNEEGFDSEYNPFMISRFLSMSPETAFFAQFINRGNLSKKDHYLFLFHILPQKRIFLKYQKKDKNTDLKFIKDCFEIGDERAKEYTKLLSKKQLKLIKKKYGGRVGRGQ